MSKTGNTSVKLPCNCYTSSFTVQTVILFITKQGKKRVFTDTLLFSNFYLALLLFYLLVIPLLWPPNRLSLLHLA